jgi:hypothetical protein
MPAIGRPLGVNLGDFKRNGVVANRTTPVTVPCVSIVKNTGRGRWVGFGGYDLQPIEHARGKLGHIDIAIRASLALKEPLPLASVTLMSAFARGCMVRCSSWYFASFALLVTQQPPFLAPGGERHGLTTSERKKPAEADHLDF